MAALIVFTTLPDSDSAVKLADTLVNGRHAACVHLLGAGHSVFRWKDKVEHVDEVSVIIKTTADAYPGLEDAIRKVHPYELPEILAVPVNRGLAEYLGWLDDQTRSGG